MQDSLSWYLKEISRTPLLSAEQEIMLGRKIQAWMPLRELDWDKLDKHQRRQYKTGERAFKHFYGANLKLVVMVATKFKHMAKTMEFMDLISEGNVGLARAVEKFDPERGYKFSTYAYWWIRQSINRGLSQQDRTIRMPTHAFEVLSKVRTFTRTFCHEHGRLPSREEICETLQIQRDILDGYLLHEAGCRSLDELANGTDSSPLIELLSDPKQETDNYWELMQNHQIYELVNHSHNSLPPKEEEVIQLRFFNQSQKQPTLQGIGDQMGLSKETTRATLAKAMRRMKLRVALQVGNPYRSAA